MTIVTQYGYVDPYNPVKARTLARSFKSPNSSLRHGDLDPKVELRPEALSAQFGRFDYNSQGSPIEKLLLHELHRF